MTTDTQQDTPPVTDEPSAATTDHQAESVESPEDAAKKVLAKARYDAFRLVTDAREEAESILDDARAEASAIVKEAEERAEAILEEAESESASAEVAPTPEEPAETSEVSAVAELEAEHQALTERVGSLRDLADQLEERFAALAATAERDDSPASGSTAVADDSPEAAAPSRETVDGDDDADEGERGSFYSRRSAKLPRIGEEGGKSALDMMRSIRETLEEDGS